MKKPKKAKEIIADITMETGKGIFWVFVCVGLYFFCFIRNILIIVGFPILLIVDSIQVKRKKNKKIKEELKKNKPKYYWMPNEKKARNYLIGADIFVFTCFSCNLPYSHFNIDQVHPNIVASIFAIILFVLWLVLFIYIFVYIKKINNKYRVKLKELLEKNKNKDDINEKNKL